MILEMVNAGREHNFVELLRGWHRSYGNTFKARMATRNVIFTVEPKNIQTVLALKFKDFGLGETRQAAIRPVFGEGIFTVDGSKWEHSRALLRPNFTRAQITDTQMYENHVAALLKKIPRDGSTVELLELFFRQVIFFYAPFMYLTNRWKTLDTATEFLFGESVHSLNDANSAEASSFANSFNIAQEGTATRFRLGPLMGLYRSKEFTEAGIDVRTYVGRFVQKAIDYRIAVNSGEKVDPAIKELTDNQYVFSYELSKQTLDKREITDQLLSILLAGRDTTANLLGTTFFILARRPDIWKKLQAEVLALDGRKPSFEELKSMTYMSWVFNECKKWNLPISEMC
jgi:cytochrome P450